MIEAGDEVLLVLDPGLEEAITAYFAPGWPAGRVLSACAKLRLHTEAVEGLAILLRERRCPG